MTDKALYYKVIRHDKIYSLLYSPIRIKEESLEDQIIEIPLTKLEWAKDYKSFTKQKIIDSWKEDET